MQNIVKEFIEKKLEKSIVLEKPKDSSLGHFATPVAFSLAKELKKSPMILADELVLKLENSELFEKIESVKGFINFTLSKSFIEKLTNEALEKKDDFAKAVISNYIKISNDSWENFRPILEKIKKLSGL